MEEEYVSKLVKLRVATTGSTISTLLHDRINPKDCQVLSLGDTGFLQFFRVVSRDYGKPRTKVKSFKLSLKIGVTLEKTGKRVLCLSGCEPVAHLKAERCQRWMT